MTTRDLAGDLRRAVPGLRGALVGAAPLAPFTWFKTGGSAEALFTPADQDDLATVLAAVPREIPVTVIGLGSNLIVRDGGVPGLVVRLGKGFSEIHVDGTHIRAGAAAPDVKVARAAADAEIDGFAFLRGIPGSIGGALPTNAGAHGGDMAAILVEAHGVDRSGGPRTYSRDDMGFSYRHCAVSPDVIFTHVLLQGRHGDAEAIQAEMNKVTAAREASQPIREKTGGSTFANPPGHSAWKLIDQAGCRGLTRGDAQVSPMHTNFLINRGAATSADIEGLGEEVRRRVRETSGIELRWEIRRIGIA
ncbi:UDP-N-acetylmuramate dehydrogenase [Lichenifustis flavocetrariae]|uniref:UDP-N-acetylenolpyruvoylglucosamine reductase n=1 Tax=Lichenifustis flavocetrariae TaxID=2949735 RepID=A0AA41Z1H5_9HYPH|nr:UDP-N-acetylmuramate dehydrogenase [Lichenifustis flavocetrariae]MCW6511115.1 UDP-N-acetylmuramate dehydrogenase [Lichenifustis flavocetrariae]